MTPAILDSSALIALILGEPGADIVADHLDGAFLSTVDLAEVVAKMMARGAPLALIRDEIAEAGIEIIPFDEAQAIRTGELRSLTRAWGLSLGDRACLALAAATGRIAVTADRPWSNVDLGVDIRLIR